ncbi:MAG: T9SS type A sorting domain-containing protein [Chitinophagaceae bacterium]|nr:T9SS type A sorting domain-containing protein [Chitinophagaceae bacterium]
MKTYFTLFLLCIGLSGFSQVKQFRSNLYIIDPKGNPVLMDGTLSFYDNMYDNAVNQQDARKMFNPSENWGMLRDNYTLIVERRQDVAGPDTIFFKMWNMRIITYRLEFSAKYFEESGVTAVLYDSYLNKYTDIDLQNTTEVDFSVTADANSKRSDRFTLIFNKEEPKPMEFTQAIASLQGDDIVIQWATINEKNIKDYTVEHSTNGVRFTESPLMTGAINQTVADYRQVIRNPSGNIHYYRVRANHVDGNYTFSEVLKIEVPHKKTLVSMYPNPAPSSNVQVKLTQVPIGVYTINLYNSFGRIVHTQNELIKANSGNIKLNTRNSVPNGLYRIEITGPEGYRTTQSILIRN